MVAKIKITLLVITHTIAPINLHSSNSVNGVSECLPKSCAI